MTTLGPPDPLQPRRRNSTSIVICKFCVQIMGTVSWGCPTSLRPHTHLPLINHPSPKRSVSLLSLYHLHPFVPTNPLLKSSLSSSPTSLQVSANATFGATNEGLEASNYGIVGENDLMIVGPGVLGRLVAEKWRQEHPGCQIYGQTVTTDHHDELVKLGINPSTKEIKAIHRYPYVIFCAPPSRTSDYHRDIKEAALSWNGKGSFLFTSSSAPFDCNDNGECNEDSPAVPIGRSPRTDVLLKAETVVVESGGCVLRLAGLYKADRGAHVYWLKKGTCDIRPDHILNLIHYEDAASLCVAILKKKFCGRIFLGCDNHPLARQDVMDLVAKSGKFGKKFEGFTGTSDPLGKRLNNTKTREEVGWEPKYPSFAHFLESLSNTHIHLQA